MRTLFRTIAYLFGLVGRHIVYRFRGYELRIWYIEEDDKFIVTLRIRGLGSMREQALTQGTAIEFFGRIIPERIGNEDLVEYIGFIENTYWYIRNLSLLAKWNEGNVTKLIDLFHPILCERYDRLVEEGELPSRLLVKPKQPSGDPAPATSTH